MVLPPGLVELITELEGDHLRDERASDENGSRAIRNAPDEVDRELVSSSMDVRAVRPYADENVRIECEIIDWLLVVSHGGHAAVGAITRLHRNRHD